MTEPEPEGAVITLHPDVALTLSHLLNRWILSDQANAPADSCFESAAECAALSDVLAQLEKQLVAPFRSDYPELLAAAHERLSLQWPSGFLQS